MSFGKESTEVWLGGMILPDKFLPFVDLERLIETSQIDRTTVASYLAAYAASAELIRNWGVGLQ